MSAIILLQRLGLVIGALFALCYFYQLVYIPVALWRKKRAEEPEPPLRRYAVLIAARNEAPVIADLIDSIHRQDYPADHIVTFVVADNCSDDTAALARNAGAVVYERSDRVHVGKGYALDYLLSRIGENWGDDYFDGYFVFDADNLLAPDYVSRMNRVFSPGRQIVTSYRNSKNFGDNWVSAGYGLWFMRDSFFLNRPRDRLGVSAVVAGTGFLFSREVMHSWGGWPFHSMSEDTEFSACTILRGQRIAYCDAEFFDEQPTSFLVSWRQRMRWSRGSLTVLAQNFRPLAAGLLGSNAGSCFDLLMMALPAFVLSIVSFLCGTGITLAGLLAGQPAVPLLLAFLKSLLAPYPLLLLAGAVTTLSQWRHIRTTAVKKVLYTFTFPFFMMTYVPIAVSALFGKVEWRPIEHKVSMSIQQLK